MPSPVTDPSWKLRNGPGAYGDTMGNTGLLCPKPKRNSFTALVPKMCVSPAAACRGWVMAIVPKYGRLLVTNVRLLALATSSYTEYLAHRLSRTPKTTSPRRPYFQLFSVLGPLSCRMPFGDDGI